MDILAADIALHDTLNPAPSQTPDKGLENSGLENIEPNSGSKNSGYKTVCSLTANLTDATPMMRQFLEIKQGYPGVLLLYRMGDFYETFFEDALTVANALELTLTGREAGTLGRVPMAGVPVKSLETYLNRLLQQNFKVAICEQMEDPALAKGLVERQVVRVISPGTLSEGQLLPTDRPNFIAALWAESQENPTQSRFGLAWADVSTGVFQVKTCTGLDRLLGELARLSPAELLVAGKWQRTEMGFPEAVAKLSPELLKALRQFSPCALSPVADEPLLQADTGEAALKQLCSVSTLSGYGLEEHPLAKRAACFLGAYLKHMFVGELPRLDGIQLSSSTDTVWMSAATRKALEINTSLRDGNKASSLWSVLNRTQTAMGARCLRAWLHSPLCGKESLSELHRRQEAIEALISTPVMRQQLAQALQGVADLERLSQRVANLTASPRELAALRRSIQALTPIAQRVADFPEAYLAALSTLAPEVSQINQILTLALADEPAPQLKQGDVIREGFHAELDGYRLLMRDQQAWLSGYEQQLRDLTGIRTLKVAFNNAFGYTIEVSRAAAQALNPLPEGWRRKQTLTNAERYTSEDLRSFETRVQEAQQQASDLEARLFVQLRQALLPGVNALKETARRVAALDALLSLAQVAVSCHYVRPTLTTGGELSIINGRHPVVEASLPMGQFVPNTTCLQARITRDHAGEHHSQAPQILMITGPNMAGKSTVMRQIALITLMAQIGAFVPAESATIGLVDAIYTRIGAVDDLAAGQSTFMVEMTETAQILNTATSQSLVILDEIGRGTSTYDGVAIAWSVAEHLVTHIGCRTAFATHYHELNALESAYPQSVQNARMTVRDQDGDIVFLHTLAPGSAQKSYGIQVAKMAGVPEAVVNNAARRLASLHKRAATIQDRVKDLPLDPDLNGMPQLSLF